MAKVDGEDFSPYWEDYADKFEEFLEFSTGTEALLSELGLGDDWETQTEWQPDWELGERLHRTLGEDAFGADGAASSFIMFDDVIQHYAAGTAYRFEHQNIGTIVGTTAHHAAATLLQKLDQMVTAALQHSGLDPSECGEVYEKPWRDCGSAAQQLLRDAELQIVDGSRVPFQFLAAHLSNERLRLGHSASWLWLDRAVAEADDDREPPSYDDYCAAIATLEKRGEKTNRDNIKRVLSEEMNRTTSSKLLTQHRTRHKKEKQIGSSAVRPPERADG